MTPQGQSEAVACPRCYKCDKPILGGETIVGINVSIIAGTVAMSPHCWPCALRASAAPGVGEQWSCEDCGCKSYARIDEQIDERYFRPGPYVRCVKCKTEFLYPATPAPGDAEYDLPLYGLMTEAHPLPNTWYTSQERVEKMARDKVAESGHWIGIRTAAAKPAELLSNKRPVPLTAASGPATQPAPSMVCVPVERNAIHIQQRREAMPAIDPNTEAFLVALTDLSVKHKIGITESGVLFELEYDDMPHSYAMDANGKLERR